MMRKVRKDSKLHGLAREQRAMVDKWLFDKGLMYQEVSEACLQMFGLKVSRSSVGRYHERQALGKVRRKKGECRKEGSGAKTGTSEEMYQETLRLMTKWAVEELQWPVEDERDIKTVLRFIRILISARREKNEADMTKLARRKFEMKAARQCLHLILERNRKGATGTRPEIEQKQTEGTKNWATDGTDFTERAWSRPERAEKDPMMMWNFPDGEIRRLPLMGRGQTD